jgi:hypothetical protein
MYVHLFPSSDYAAIVTLFPNRPKNPPLCCDIPLRPIGESCLVGFCPIQTAATLLDAACTARPFAQK